MLSAFYHEAAVRGLLEGPHKTTRSLAEAVMEDTGFDEDARVIKDASALVERDSPRARIVLPRPGGHGWLPFRQALLRR